MKCLSCHNELTGPRAAEYHVRCARTLFDTSWVPSIKFGYDDIPEEARKLVGRMSISGVQQKLSVGIKKGDRTLEVMPTGGHYILKPSPEQWPNLAENENLCMNMSALFSIETPPHGLLPLSDGRLVYVVRRFDRAHTEGGLVKVHVEDFAQLLEADDKYSGSVEQIGKFLKKRSEIPYIDVQKLFSRILYYFLIGNGDAHLKNFAMIDTPEGFRLAPAFDVASSRLAIPNEAEEFAIAISGRKNNVRLKDFETFADYLEIKPKTCKKIFASFQRSRDRVISSINEGFLTEEMKGGFVNIFNERFARLFSGK